MPAFMQKTGQVCALQEGYRCLCRGYIISEYYLCSGSFTLAKTIPFTFALCGEVFRRFQSRAKRYSRIFCSLTCSVKDKKSDRKGCISKSTGYRQVSIE